VIGWLVERRVSNMASVGKEKTISTLLYTIFMNKVVPVSKSRRTPVHSMHRPRKLDLHAVGPSRTLIWQLSGNIKRVSPRGEEANGRGSDVIHNQN
jgi:hypothetical protein